MNEHVTPPGPIDPAGERGVITVNLREALEERYLAYALSTIMNRALPDVRDGMKPVHRRILYAMLQMRLMPGGGYKKSAKVVGEVMGNFHPHGDQAIYEAMVRLAQDFAVRYPLVDGQGNFGNIDGDGAAAYRYTEARMAETARLLLDGIDEDAVDFRPTYDGTGEEPVVLPAAFPNLLANGASGIAVGMATNIPPHNVAELCSAALRLLKNPETPLDALLKLVPGPDFPTGGVIVSSRDEIAHAYKTGRGAFRTRARWNREVEGRGGWTAVVTEIPYQVQKGRLIEQIAGLIEGRKLPLVADIRDESAEDVRIVIEPRSRTIDPALMMESLFRLSDLESRFSLNMNVLSHGCVPNVLGLRGVLLEWLEHRSEVLLRRSRHRLDGIAARLGTLEAYLVAYLNLDEVIRIIREEDEPKAELMRRFDLREAQAEAILNMRLRSLRKLDEIEIRREHDALTAQQADLQDLLSSEERQRVRLGEEITEVKKRFAAAGALGRRRTGFADAPEIDANDIQDAIVEREPVTIVISEKGWLRALKGHVGDVSSLAFKEGDRLRYALHARTTDKLLLFSTTGRFYTLEVGRLPSGRGQGEPVRLTVDLEPGDDIIAALVHDPMRRLLVASHAGFGFLVPEAQVIATTRKGKQILNVAAPDQARLCIPASGDHAAIIGTSRKMLVFPLSQLPEMARGKGLRLQRYAAGGLSDARVFAGADGLSWTDGAGRTHTRTLADLKDWVGDRGQAGRLAPTGMPKTNRFG